MLFLSWLFCDKMTFWCPILIFHMLVTIYLMSYQQGSPNQVKWTTFSPWFQWNRPISVKKRSFSRPVSLFKSVFFSPIIILFLQCSRKRSSHVPEIWSIQGFEVQYFIPNSLIASFLRSLCSTFVLWKVGDMQ
jgi:hypothetical protein